MFKIFTIYHRPAATPKDEGYSPLLVGNSIFFTKNKDGYNVNEESRKNFSRQFYVDDSCSDNLSSKNRSINEMSGIYWIWKQLNLFPEAEFIGITHYRRFFIFDESLPLPSNTWLPNSTCYEFNSLDEANKYINSSLVEHFFKIGYDCLAPKMYDARLLEPERRPNVSSCEERFYEIAKFDPTLYKLMENLVLKYDKSYSFELQELRSAPRHYTFNMFIMKRTTFEKYCSFIFPILKKIDEANTETEDTTKRRGPGYLSEFLTSIFLSHELRVNNLKIKELNTCFIRDTSINSDCKKLNMDNNPPRPARFLFLTTIYILSYGKLPLKYKIEFEKSKIRKSGDGTSTIRIISNKLSNYFLKLSQLLKV